MKSFKIISIIGAILFISGCAYTNQIAMAPKVERIEISKPIPLEVALLISEESRSQIFKSSPPDYPYEWPGYFIEPYQLPLGEAFEKAALQIFSQFFQKVDLIRTPEEAKKYQVILEPRLADFSVHSDYYGFNDWVGYHGVVFIHCRTKVVGTLRNQGKTIWQKTIETPKVTQYPVLNQLLGTLVGEEASDSMVQALEDLARNMVQESHGPPRPGRGWLEEIK